MAGILGGVSDALFGNTDSEDKKAREYLERQMANAEALQAPELQELDPFLQQYLGDLQLQGIDQGRGLTYDDLTTAFDSIQADPTLRARQGASLSALDAIASGGGLNAADVANLNRIQNATAQADRGRREAILQGMAARGAGGSGLELLAQLDSSQAATDQANQAGLDVAAQAQARALDAIMQSSGLAGNLRAQDFNEAAQRASARDAIERFNASNKLAVQQANKGNELDVNKWNANTANSAAQANWGAKQDTANTNTAIQNQANQWNVTQKPLAQFDAEAKKTGMQNEALAAGQAYWTGQGDREAAKAGATLGAIGTIAGGAMMMSDEREKEAVKPLGTDEIRDFLAAIQPKKYRYKKPEAPGAASGERLGFMLQDVQGTEAGKSLTEELPDGRLAYDPNNLDGIMLAALSDISRRLDKKEGGE